MRGKANAIGDDLSQSKICWLREHFVRTAKDRMRKQTFFASEPCCLSAQ